MYSIIYPRVSTSHYDYSKVLEGYEIRSGHYQPDRNSDTGITCHISHVLKPFLSDSGKDSSTFVKATYIGIHYGDYYYINRYAPNQYQFLPPHDKAKGTLITHIPKFSGVPATRLARDFRGSGSTSHVGLHTHLSYICHEWNVLVEWDSEVIRQYVERAISNLGIVKQGCKRKYLEEEAAEKKQAEDSKHDWKHDISINL